MTEPFGYDVFLSPASADKPAVLGGFDRNVIEPSTLTKMIDYIQMNPVRRGLVEKPEDWKCSSAAWYLRG